MWPLFAVSSVRHIPGGFYTPQPSKKAGSTLPTSVMMRSAATYGVDADSLRASSITSFDMIHNSSISIKTAIGIMVNPAKS